MNKLHKLFLNTDGGSRGNPGPAATGYVIYDASNQVLKAGGRYLGETTNNVAEYQALIDGLMASLEYQPLELVIRMDSELIVKQMQGQYKIKQPHLQQMAQQVRALLMQIHNYQFEHVLREKNSAADQQVNLALDQALKK